MTYRVLIRGVATPADLGEAADELGLGPGAKMLLCHPDVLAMPVQTAGARSSDPDTSQKAALEVAPQAASLRGRILIVVVRAGERGVASFEIEAALGIREDHKRTSELQQGGWIRATGETRINPRSGREQQVYVATEKGIAYGALRLAA